ncbi:MAG: LysM peptidoglycan-binding domain-containing protein [Leptospiraceae bacterium]|nr:LysM peptidoglycan-binding domain-containing protein [Leptospiraceae bacterium]
MHQFSNPRRKLALSIPILLAFFACKTTMPISSMTSAKKEISRAKSFQADKHAPAEFQEARQSLFEAHNLAANAGQSASDIKKSADYARAKALDAIEKSIPSYISGIKEATESSISTAKDAYADVLASREFKEGLDLKEKAASEEEEASKLLSTYQSKESEEDKARLRNDAFSRFVEVKKTLELSKSKIDESRLLSLAQGKQIGSSTSDVDEKIKVLDAYSSEKEAIEPLKNLRGKFDTDLSQGKVKDAIDDLDKLRQDTDKAFLAIMKPRAKENLEKAKSNVDMAEKQVFSIDTAIVKEDEELKKLNAEFHTTLAASKKKLEESMKDFSSDDFAKSIDNSTESNKLAEKAIESSQKLVLLTKKISEELARKRAEEEKKKRELEEKEKEQQKKVVEPEKEEPSYRYVWKKYRVKKNNTLWKIANKKEFFGKPKAWKQIYKANKKNIKDPDLIYPGQIITIPIKVKVPVKKSKCKCAPSCPCAPKNGDKVEEKKATEPEDANSKTNDEEGAIVPEDEDLEEVKEPEKTSEKKEEPVKDESLEKQPDDKLEIEESGNTGEDAEDSEEDE